MKQLFRIACASLALWLSGCAATPRLSSAALVKDCAQSTATDATDGIYLITSRLPDCHDPNGVLLTNRRGDGSDETAWTQTRDAMRFAFAPVAADRTQPILLNDAQSWWSSLEVKIKQAPEAGVLVFFHGYNNSPQQVLERVVMIRQRTHFGGPIVAFIWPSQASLFKYLSDEADNEWTRYYAQGALEHIASISPRVIVVAHSMGNRIAGDALAALDRNKPDLALNVKTIVLASPDVDRGLFVRDFTRLLAVRDRTITVYASAHDIALHSSAVVHGYRQAGDVSCKFSFSKKTAARRPHCYPLINGTTRLTMVDTTLISTGNGHADFVESNAGAADFCRVVNGFDRKGGAVATDHPYVFVLTKDAETGDACQAAP
jgi:pimeloyl-ACP methyl ester carboxylesterase